MGLCGDDTNGFLDRAIRSASNLKEYLVELNYKLKGQEAWIVSYDQKPRPRKVILENPPTKCKFTLFCK